ncbi:lipoyl(octanoyl) transferase [Terrimicrobium sacchariphilum]|uniref:Octanoyltransferase n=1 Tax=Terrimicrobium sacchariphilum TaxID=690879 RepID=A0A146G8T5_TERSA|nr:lipoyl(octanoyl) transferase LipB [Terrimicrobium sacchariphilum]GAT34109.1 lipoyl(octanoyl) transferase [Terrimicrobium sacchariphilum]
MIPSLSHPEVQWLGSIEYAAALDLQNQLVDQCLEGGPEKLLLLEHEPVYTIGRTRDQSSLRQPTSLPHPVFEINRGGQATWHGPGQLVGYPILRLAERGRDLHLYLRFLEEVIILTCAECGFTAGRRDGLTGVWVEDRKLASLGVGVRKWISMHGLALNVTLSSLEAFNYITPCGIAGVQMTCIEKEAARPFTVQEVGDILARIFLRDLPTLA